MQNLFKKIKYCNTFKKTLKIPCNKGCFNISKVFKIVILIFYLTVFYKTYEAFDILIKVLGYIKHKLRLKK